MKSFGEGFVTPVGADNNPVAGSASYAFPSRGVVVIPPPQGTTLDGRPIAEAPEDPRKKTVKENS